MCSDTRPIGDFTRRLKELLPDADIQVDEDESAGHAHQLMDNTRLVNHLGYVPDYTLEAGLEDYMRRSLAYYGADSHD